MTEINSRADFLETVKDKWWHFVESQRLTSPRVRFLLNTVLLPRVYTDIEWRFRHCRAELALRDDPDFARAYEGEFKDIYKHPDHIVDNEDDEAMERYERLMDLDEAKL
jgi:hypothetical protein